MAVIGCLLSVGASVTVLGVPGLIVDITAGRSPDNPAGLGITGALPGGALSGDSGGAGLHEFPTPPDLPDGPLGIPGVVLGAYQFAERTLAASRPSCHTRRYLRSDGARRELDITDVCSSGDVGGVEFTTRQPRAGFEHTATFAWRPWP